MLLFLDGMAHYGSSEIAYKYTTRDDSHCTWSVVSEGRTGNCLKRVSTSNAAQTGYLGVAPFATRTGLWAPQPSGVCGFAIKVDDLVTVNGGTANHGLLVIEETGMDSPIGAQPFHLRVDLQSNGTFSVYRRAESIAGDINLGNSIEGLQSNAWAYVEFKWLIDAGAGYFEIRVNTIPVLTFTGQTRVTDAANFGYWTSVRLFSVASEPGPPWLTMRFSDLYVADGAGGAGDVKDFLGDGTILTIVPNGPGLATGWTPSAAPNWDQVNDRPAPDGDATSIETTTPGTRDCYHYEDIPSDATVLGVHYNILARKLDEGTVTVKPIVGQGGTQYDGPTQGIASTEYDRYLTQPYDLNPATGAAWTAAEINAGQWGVLKQA